MPANAGDLASRPVGWDDIDQGKPPLPQAKQLGGASVGDHGPLTACQIGGKHSARSTDDPMPNRERSPEKWMKVAASRPKRDLTVAQPKRPQLLPRNNPMLALRQLGDPPVHASGASFALHGCTRRTGTKFAPRAR